MLTSHCTVKFKVDCLGGGIYTDIPPSLRPCCMHSVYEVHAHDAEIIFVNGVTFRVSATA